MSLLKRLKSFTGYASEVARLGPTPPARLWIGAVSCWLLARQYVPRLPAPAVPVQVARHGQRLRVWLQTYGDLVVLRDTYGLDEYADLATPGEVRTILDAGANIGLSVLDFRARFPGARIVACEPDPRAFALLARATADDPLTEIHQVALADHDGVMTFFTSAASMVSSLQRTLPEQTPIEVRTATLESFLAEQGLDTVDIFKIDVEGAEGVILADARPLARIGTIVGEIHPPLLNEDAESFCERHLPGFDVRVIRRPGFEESPERLFSATRI